MTANVKIVAVLTARADTVDRLHALLDAMLKPSRAEPGNLRYDLWQDQSDPNRFVLDELYADADAVAAPPRDAPLPELPLSDRRSGRARRVRPQSRLRDLRVLPWASLKNGWGRRCWHNRST